MVLATADNFWGQMLCIWIHLQNSVVELILGSVLPSYSWNWYITADDSSRHVWANLLWPLFANCFLHPLTISFHEQSLIYVIDVNCISPVALLYSRAIGLLIGNWHRADTVVLQFNQYAPGSRWRHTTVNRRNHREEGNEADGFYGGIRKLDSEAEISTWKRLWPAQVLEWIYQLGNFRRPEINPWGTRAAHPDELGS